MNRYSVTDMGGLRRTPGVVFADPPSDGAPQLVCATVDAWQSALATLVITHTRFGNVAVHLHDDRHTIPACAGAAVTSIAESNNADGPCPTDSGVPTTLAPADPFTAALPEHEGRAIWGKTDMRGGTDDWGLLITHLSDAANVAGLVWDHWLAPKVVRQLGGIVGDPVLARKLFVFLAGAHDVGKASPAFVSQSTRHCAAVEHSGLPVSGGDVLPAGARRVPHGVVGALATLRLLDPTRPLNTIPAGIGAALAAAVWAHHGYFPEDVTASPYDGLSPPSGLALPRGTYPAGAGYRADHKPTGWTRVQDALVGAAQAAAGLTAADLDALRNLDPPMHYTTVMTGGLVATDWIASGTDQFPLGDPPPTPSRERALGSARTMLLNTPRWTPQYPADVAGHLAARFPGLPPGASPRPVQRALVDAALGCGESAGLIVVEAPTGVGKTEGALLAAEIIAAQVGCSGVFFALPTRATADAVYSRLTAWLATQDPDLVAHLVHGKASLNHECTRWSTPSSRASMGDSADQCGSMDDWLHEHSKGILASFAVGTVDQLLRAGAAGKHYALRHLGLAGKVVIIDEVHSNDTRMLAFLARTLRWLGRLEVPVIAMSATLTPAVRQVLHSAYSGDCSTYVEAPDTGRGVRRTSRRRGIQFPGAAAVLPYPCITASRPLREGETGSVDDTLAIRPVDHDGGRKVRVIEVTAMSPEDVASAVLEHVGGVGVAAVICNTVARAVECAELLRASGAPVSLLHSRFTAGDRSAIEGAVHAIAGRGGVRPTYHIVVATQVVEQSLDLDFDVMYTDIAPMDVLVQRMGRLHRHAGRARPTRHADPVLLIGGYSRSGDAAPTFPGGFSKVYHRVHLLRTAYVLSGRTAIHEPGDVPELVSSIDDPESTPWPTEECAAADALARHVRHQQGRAAESCVAYAEGVPVPWRGDGEPLYAHVRAGVSTLEAVVVFRSSCGELHLPSDAHPGAGKRLDQSDSGASPEEVALRSVPLPIGLSSALTGSQTGRSQRRGRPVIDALRPAALEGMWSGRPELSGIAGALVLCADDGGDPSSGTGVLIVDATRWIIRYDSAVGLRCNKAELE